ncbi:hypothetical protein [Caenibius tardaugens]|uniref:hypothetical protein n=1 Tax=Caenibius tardaugens TaxID=169176 RepID=UPI001B355922|nr:hypothetical protein [Caenibius tardaugens]
MSFAGKVWRLLVGVKDALALLFLLLFFIGLYAVLTTRPSPGQVRGGALLLELDGTVVEEASQTDPLQVLLSQEMPTREYQARDLVRAIDNAATDDRIRAVVLDLSRFLGGGRRIWRKSAQRWIASAPRKNPFSPFPAPMWTMA